jgi:hypothetical protein
MHQPLPCGTKEIMITRQHQQFSSTVIGPFLYVLVTSINALPCTKIAHEAIVTVSGRLIMRIFPGAPNYQSIKKGDAADFARILVLDKPVCLYPLPGNQYDDFINDVKKTQLILLDPGIWERTEKLFKLHVQFTGSFFSAQTGHHHTPAMFMVKGICSDESKQPVYRCAAGN